MQKETFRVLRSRRITAVKRQFRKSRRRGQIYDEICRAQLQEIKEQEGCTHLITDHGHFRLPIKVSDFPRFPKGEPCDLLLRKNAEIVGIRIGGFEFAHTEKSAKAEIEWLSEMRRNIIRTITPEALSLLRRHMK